MANKEYYQFWLNVKNQLKTNISDDIRLQELANKSIGLKPQGVAVEVVARVYCKYCDLYNKLCECYDQMTQVQRRPHIRNLIDVLTCRILELKSIFENVESFEYTYPENALQQMFMIPKDIQILCPFFYSFEIRQEEKQYIIDQIMAGNRLGDPEPTPSELERREEELEEERIMQEQNEAIRKMKMGDDFVPAEPSVVLTPEEIEHCEFLKHVLNIQRMERSRVVIKEITHKINKEENLYLELAGLKAPQASEEIQSKATLLIQLVYRKFIALKREKARETKLREMIGMVKTAASSPSHKDNLEKVQSVRRTFRHKYYKEWLDKNIKEKSRVMRLRRDDIMEDISDEIRQWWQEWYNSERVFDEYPWPEEGGSILVVRGETFTIAEYIKWREIEEKRLKEEAASPKSKEQIKAEKLAEKEEKKRLAAEAKEREIKKQKDYRKQRLNPDSDPGVYLKIGNCLTPVQDAWTAYDNEWKAYDVKEQNPDVLRGYMMEFIIETAYEEVQIELRPLVDEIMRLELTLLKNALKLDCLAAETKVPLTKKRKKPRKIKPPKPDKLSPEFMFQQLFDRGVIRTYPHITLNDFWGDKNYAAADLRAVPWTPKFPEPCMGDVEELVRLRCILTLGCNCTNAIKTQLLVGPKSSGKRTLVYAIATETNSILIDLSPMNIYNKYPGPKNLKTLFQLVNKVSRLMQPAVILIDNVDKVFYKKVPKEEKMFDPTRLQKDLYKEIIKQLTPNDKILVIGTCSEPWLAKAAPLKKAFPSVIMLPRSDYGSISYILNKMLMKYHGVDREFNVHSVAQVVAGYDIKSIINAVYKQLNSDRQVSVWHKPLQPEEVLSAILDLEGANYVSEDDYILFKDWYASYTPWGETFEYYKFMIEKQMEYKIKNEKKKQ